jgi:hypothetical protein
MLTQQLYTNNLVIIIDKIVFILGYNLMKSQFVQSVLPQEDVISLKKKTGKSSIKEAISKAVYYYLKEGVSNTNDN